MVEKTLISTDALYSKTIDRDWVIVDCSFDLANPDWGWEHYLKGHIPAAVYAHLERDLSAPKTVTSGRHPLPQPKHITESFSRWGISTRTQVVVYDQGDGSMAARLWWLLRYYGHSAVAVLDGGLPAWSKAGYELEFGETSRSRAHFSGQPNSAMVVDYEAIKAKFQDPDWLLVDSRAPERFRGEVEPIDPVAGHIPGSVNFFYGANLAPTGRYKDAATLSILWERSLNLHDPQHVIVYCGSGVTSCANLLAMEIAGLHGSLLYPGSWSEWISRSNSPIALGE